MMRKKLKLGEFKGITLISLVITIIVLMILSSVAIYLSLGNNGIFIKAKQAKEETNKQEATDIINLKITTAQMNKYVEEQKMPTLQELADILYEDNEIQYVTLESKVADKEKVTVGEKTSIFTKLEQYPYEFEINSSLQLASINGVKIANNTNINSAYEYSLEEKVVGKWLDGKDLYQKTVECGDLVSGYKTIPHNIDNIDNIIDAKGISKGTTDFRPIPYSNNTDNVILLRADKTNIYIWTGPNIIPSIDTYVTLQYTKNID